jgi:L-alanine-DL-glutamate epimerase-like enolase superfamily enzyme
VDRRDFLKRAVLGGAAALTAHFRAACGWAGPLEQEQMDTKAATKQLAEHRIAKFTTRRLQDRYPRHVGPNARGQPVGRGGGDQVRIVTTDRGAVGWAMNHWPHERVKRFIGARVGDLFDLERGTDPDAFELDKILHDLAGNILGKPAHALLGGKGPRQVWLYSGAIYFDDLLPRSRPRGVKGVLASCRQDYDAGYRAFKLKIGRGFKWMPRPEGLKRDIEVTRTVAQTFPDCRVLVDANDGYRLPEMIDFVKAIADCNLYWIEEPFEENRDKLKRLREAMAKAGCKALIADGEARKSHAKRPTRYGGYTRQFAERLIRLGSEKLVDVCLFDLGIVGFTRWRHLMPVLEQAGLAASPHTWMWTPRPFYAAQLAAGVGNVPIVEGIPGRAKGIDYSAYTMKAGKLVMPKTPGFGLRLS